MGFNSVEIRHTHELFPPAVAAVVVVVDDPALLDALTPPAVTSKRLTNHGISKKKKSLTNIINRLIINTCINEVNNL